MMGCLKFVSVLCLFFSVVLADSEDPPVVTTSQGRIVGTRLEFSPIDSALRRSVDAYLGIPYAEAPVGPLRFKPPVAKSWSGELQATRLGNRCPQPLVPFGNYTLNGPFDEDCLFLDVFVPQSVPPDAAVLVYIHGGAYIVGAGVMMDLYPTAIASVGDVIAVTLNYRLGALGFLSTNDDVIPGNMGLLDQRLALEWVRDNIKAFGGDPARVAIFGESAGAGSIGVHMVSPGSGGLYRGAILESGDATAPWATASVSKARRLAFTFGKLVGCERQTSEELLECLQQVEGSDKFIENQQEKLLEELGEGPSMIHAPIVDGEVIPADPNDLYKQGAINDAVSIIGALSDEGMLMLTPSFPNNTDEAPFVDRDTFDAQAKFQLACVVSPEPIVADAAMMMYRNASCADMLNCDQIENLAQLLGDAMFVCSGVKTAKAFTKAGRKVYHYHMSHVPTTPMLGNKWTKATHGDDLIFVFGLPLVPSANWSFTEDEARMSIQTIKYWANLAKTGNPNLSSLDGQQGEEENLPEWPLFTLEELAYKDLSPSMGNGRGIKAKECILWNEFIPKLIQISEEAKKCQEAQVIDEDKEDVATEGKYTEEE
ncbi:cholinesterase 1-like isoform X1 [Acanthaster planci]|uniref:Carboxylic ester hydrolase n=2 Tax=Acanthaster planci TaxID=133434 RepID=A0A8B7Y0H3_ACAPL|nr:cholinesterase 1-like isoform X1 [Acanthaster planci]